MSEREQLDLRLQISPQEALRRCKRILSAHKQKVLPTRAAPAVDPDAINRRCQKVADQLNESGLRPCK